MTDPLPLSGCPCCGQAPTVENSDTCLEITCCVSLSIQKSDFLTLDERTSWDQDTCRFGDAQETKAFNAAAAQWNERAPVASLVSALSACRGRLAQYAEADEDAGLCGGGCYTQPFEQIRPELERADNALAPHRDLSDGEAWQALRDLVALVARQKAFSEKTFGPGGRTAGIIDHIGKELNEIRQAPTDVEEWSDIILLALDGAWRAGASPQQVAQTVIGKLLKNESRTWPDWRDMPPDQAIEHERGSS